MAAIQNGARRYLLKSNYLGSELSDFDHSFFKLKIILLATIVFMSNIFINLIVFQLNVKIFHFSLKYFLI